MSSESDSDADSLINGSENKRNGHWPALYRLHGASSADDLSDAEADRPNLRILANPMGKYRTAHSERDDSDFSDDDSLNDGLVRNKLSFSSNRSEKKQRVAENRLRGAPTQLEAAEALVDFAAGPSQNVPVSHNLNHGTPLSPWGNKCKAKIQIWKELSDPLSPIHFMEVGQIHKKWAPLYNLKRFRANFKAMKSQQNPIEKESSAARRAQGTRWGERKKEVEPWVSRNKVSKAYSLLFKLFMDVDSGVHRMEAEKIWKSHECFQDYPLAEFKQHVKDMAAKTSERRELIAQEEGAYQLYAAANPRNDLTDRNVPFWDTHTANKLLEADFEDGTANSFASRKDHWLSREEYQDFPLGTFRNHFYQERRKQLAGPYWQLKRNIKAQMEHDKQVANMKSEWQANHLDEDISDLMKELEL